MKGGYQIVELENRVSDVLTLLGQRCADIHQLIDNDSALSKVQIPPTIRYISIP